MKEKTYLQDQKKLDGKEFPRWVVAQQMSLRKTSKFKAAARSQNEIIIIIIIMILFL